jgi:hypothetical protein
MDANNIFKLTRRQFVTSVILGTTAGVIATLAERVDALATGGSATPFGYINTYMWILVSAVLFGTMGAIITTEVQAIIGLITYANPLSWLWPFINLIFAIGVGLTLWGLMKIKTDASIRSKLVLMSITCALLNIPFVYIVIVLVLGLPATVYLWLLPFYIVLQLIPATILAYAVVRVILRAKILDIENLKGKL